MRNEIHESVTATELVRNLAGVIDRVRISGQSLYITKGTQTVAELSPPPKSGCSIEQLVDVLSSLPKLDQDASAMAADIKKIKGAASIPENPWD